MNHWVHDYETLSNCFVGVFEHYKEDTRKIFVVHKLMNHLPELIKFLEGNVTNKEWHISFNGLSFDSQITEFILKEKDILLQSDPEDVAKAIYLQAQEVIDRQERGEWAEYSEKNLKILQVDVFKLNHWDNPAKRSSLKWIQYTMDWMNMQEMPIHHSTFITTAKEINQIIDYCCNDVRSTKRILHLSSEQVNLRSTLTAEYNIPLYSASEPRISKELFLHFLSKRTGIRKYELKQLRTNRERIKVSDILLPYIKFNRPEFQQLHDAYKKLVINPTRIKGAFKHVTTHKEVKTEYGLGGLHGAAKKGIYESDDQMIIMTSDVTSFYPNLAIRNKWSPAHLPKEEFCELYEWYFDERVKIPKKDPKNYVYKLILNSTFGLSIDPNSFLYDPQFGMQITINGQLLLTMLYEMLSDAIPESIPLMQNTDGLEMMIPVKHKDKYMEVCAEWEKITKLQLEHDQYKKLILADVNNYIAIHLNGKTKCKGRFEFEGLALHKNKSHLVIRKALYDYFVKDVPPERHLAENKNIFDYCAGVKIKGDWEFQQICVVPDIPEEYKNYTLNQMREFLLKNGWEQSWSNDNWVRSDAINKEANTGTDTKIAFLNTVKKQMIIDRVPLPKTLRYFISHSGCKITKVNKSDGRQIQLEAGPWLQEIYNKAEPRKWEEYDIDEKYYLDHIYKEIADIVPQKKSKQYELTFE